MSVLILGAGPRIGLATAETFAAAGYQVALASRSANKTSSYKHFFFDASKPESIPQLFADVRKAIGIPRVIIYNAYSDHVTAPETPFETPIDVVCGDMNVNAISPWVAARESVQCFQDLGLDGLGVEGGTFIFTGNLFNVAVAPGFLTFGMGKSAASHLIKYLALVGYTEKPYKFYWADERHEDGQPKPAGLSGPAHAQLYLELAQDLKQRDWQHTFVEGKGFTKFDQEDVWHP